MFNFECNCRYRNLGFIVDFEQTGKDTAEITVCLEQY